MPGAESFLGLTTSVDKRGASNQNMAVMERMLAHKQNNDLQEQQAEAGYADVVNNVRAQASLLLESDRAAVNEYSNKLISEMKARLKAVGGTKKAFMKSGGLTQLADYRANVLGSDPFITGKNNQAYMQRILLLKEQGKGHLINERDMKALTNYNANGGGKLSYTGVLNEIEIDDRAFEYGTTVTPQQVLDAGDNRYKIMANYEADTGLQYNPSEGDRDLLAYIKYKGYGGMGTNTMMAKTRMDQLKAKQKAEATPTPSVATTITNAMASGVKTHADMTFETGYGKKPGEGLNNMNVSLLGAKADKAISTTDKALLGLRDPERYNVKGGAKIASGKEREFAMEFYGLDVPNEDGTITVDPLTANNTYDGKGSKLSGKWKWTNWEGNYKPMGIVMGYKGKDRDGEEMLIMEAVNKDGSPDLEKNAELYGDQNPDGEPVLMIRMHDPDNPSYDFFQEVEANSAVHSHMLGQNLGDDNNIDDSLKEQQELQIALDKADILAEKSIRSQNKKLQEVNTTINTGVESAMNLANTSATLESPYFKLLVSQHNSGAVKRDMLVQSYYQAASLGEERKLIAQADAKAFNLALDEFGLGELLSRNDLSDDQFIQKYYEADKNSSKENKENTYTFARTWKEILDRNMNPTK